MKVRQSYGPPRSLATTTVATLAAGLVVVMLLGQLYKFEDLAVVLSAVMPFDDLALTAALAAGLVLIELLALPYLLAMYLSPLMRSVSASAAIVVALFWVLVCFTNAHAANVGMMSSSVELAGGILPALLAITLAGLIISVVSTDSKFRHVGPTS